METVHQFAGLRRNAQHLLNLLLLMSGVQSKPPLSRVVVGSGGQHHRRDPGPGVVQNQEQAGPPIAPGDVRDIDESNALDHVYGYGVGLDMTRQDLQGVAQELRRPWAISKSFDHSAPVGPLHRAAEIGHPESGRIWLSVNGEVKQDSDLSRQRWSVSEAIAILSRHYELAAGDIILTGTPARIGLVEPGDKINTGVAGLGEIEVEILHPR